MRRMMMSWALAHVKGNSGERRLETSAVRPRCGYWSTNRPIRALCLICVQWFEPWMKGWAHGSGVSQPVCLWTSSFQTLWTKRNLSPLKNISSLTSAFVFLHFWVFANFFRLHKDRKCRFRDPVEHTNTKSTGFSMRFWMEDFSFLDLWRTKNHVVNFVSFSFQVGLSLSSDQSVLAVCLSTATGNGWEGRSEAGSHAAFEGGNLIRWN